MGRLNRRRNWIIGLLVVAGIVFFAIQAHLPTSAAQPKTSRAKSKHGTESPAATTIRVTTVHPNAGGTARRTSLPCSAHWHDYVDLYAKVSGYLEEQAVDIGSRVKEGEALLKIDVPELESDIEQASATFEQALAMVKQAEAKKKSAITGQHVAEANCTKASADIERLTAEHKFRDKELQRFQTLHQSNSIQGAIVDEKLFQLESVAAGVKSGEASLLTSKEQLAAAEAHVELADADLGVAKAQADVAKANLNKCRLYASFARIVSPYDGVITARHFHRGDFIRAADKGTTEPLLTVGRTNLIRVVVHIPDSEVPFAHAGDAVKIDFDSLPGKSFTSALSRVSYSEDRAMRTMRAEVDLPNDDGLIVDQMYGRMEIELEPAAKTATIPSVCLVGNLEKGGGQVFVVKDGVAKLTPVLVGSHDGVTAEILEGLSVEEHVIVRPPAGLADGTTVSPEAAHLPPRS